MLDVSGDGSGDVWARVRKLADAIILSKNETFEERPCEPQDFAAQIPKNDEFFVELLTLVQNLPQFAVEKLSLDDRAALLRLILACGEHSKDSAWTSKSSLDLSKVICTSLCSKCSLKKTNEIICHPSVLKQIWPLLCPKLAQSCWKCYPAAVQCFNWILLQIESPVLGEHLVRVFPPTLVILDDWEIDNKILGCRLMCHLVDNVTRAELQRQKYDDVAFDSLQRLMYEREAILALDVVKCLAALVAKVDHRYSQPFELGRYDKVLKVLLGQMEMEQGLQLRQVYAEALPILLTSGSICLALWSQRIFRILAEYVTIEDESSGRSQLLSVKAMLIFLQKTWPRASSYANQVLSTLLRLLIGLTQESPTIKADKSNREELITTLGQCLQVLSSSAPERCKELISGLDEVSANEEFHQVIKSNVVFQD